MPGAAQLPRGVGAVLLWRQRAAPPHHAAGNEVQARECCITLCTGLALSLWQLARTPDFITQLLPDVRRDPDMYAHRLHTSLLRHSSKSIYCAQRKQCLAGRSIPITIRNFFKLEAPGTVIGDFVTAEDGSGGQFVKGFATIDDVALINVEVTPGITMSVAPHTISAVCSQQTPTGGRPITAKPPLALAGPRPICKPSSHHVQEHPVLSLCQERIGPL